MDYPVLVNPGKPSIRTFVKKKTRATAAGAAKRRKSGAAARRKKISPGLSAPPDDSRLAVRRLRAKLAQAQARIDEFAVLGGYRFPAEHSQPPQLRARARSCDCLHQAVSRQRA